MNQSLHNAKSEPLYLVVSLVLGLFSTFFPSTATTLFAETNTKKNSASDSESKLRDSEKYKKLNANISVESREKKHLTMVGQFGLIDVLHYGYGAHIGYFLSPDTIIELDSFSAKTKDSQTGESSKVSLATIRAKYFLGDTFFVNTGFGKRTLFQKDLGFLESSSDQRREFKATSIVGEIVLGNRLEWYRFTMVFDWIGYVMPVAQLSSTDRFGPNAQEGFKSRSRANQERDKKKGNLLLLRLGVGLSI